MSEDGTLATIVAEETEGIRDEAEVAKTAAEDAVIAAHEAEATAQDVVAIAEIAKTDAQVEAAKSAATYIEGNEAWRKATAERLTTLENRSATAESLLLSIQATLMPPQIIEEPIPASEEITDLDTSLPGKAASDVQKEALPEPPAHGSRRRGRWI